MLRNIFRILWHYRKYLELSVNAEQTGYAALQCGDVLWRLGNYPEARVMFDKAEVQAAKFPALRIHVELARSEMALSENHPAEAAVRVRRILSQGGNQESATGVRLLRTLGLRCCARDTSRKASRSARRQWQRPVS